MSHRHRILLTGGGTGGHIYPALAVYEQLKDDPEVEAILYIGARGHLEERIAAEGKIDFVGLDSVGLPRRISASLFAWPFKTLHAVQAAKKAMARFRPTVVLGTGGYASAPALAAATLSAVPFAIHEPDAHPGLVNRMFAPYAKVCSLGMEGATSRLNAGGRVVVNGNPLRGSFLNPPGRKESCALFGLKEELKTLLITGGSQGAQAINDTAFQMLPDLLALEPSIQIVHQVGEKNFEEYKARLPAEIKSNPRYLVRAYFDDLAQLYALCDLTICRAGAMTIAELEVTGTAAIFIPFPFAAQDHQTFNARFVESMGAAVVVPQSELNASDLLALLKTVVQDQSKLDGMRTAMKSLGKPNAARDLATQLKELSAAYQPKMRAS